jgi:hypothetical protein
MVSKNSKRKSRKTLKKKIKNQKGCGFTHDLTKTVGGLMERVGYSECCPPVYNNNQMIIENGQPMCGGSLRKSKKYTKKTNRNKKHRSSRGKQSKEYLLTIM